MSRSSQVYRPRSCSQKCSSGSKGGPMVFVSAEHSLKSAEQRRGYRDKMRLERVLGRNLHIFHYHYY